MVKKHLSRLNAPRTWPIKRKGIKFVIKQSPGPHNFHSSMPALLVIKELAGLAEKAKEARKILREGNLAVNGVVRKSAKFPIGTMDVVEFPAIKKQYRMMLTSKGKFTLVPINEKDAGVLLLKIKNKKVIRGGKIQLNFTNGENMLIEAKDKDKFSVGDTVVIDKKTRKLSEVLKLEKGSLAYLSAGKKVGTSGVVEGFKKLSKLAPENIVIKTKDEEFETRKSYAFVVGKGKSLIKLPEK